MSQKNAKSVFLVINLTLMILVLTRVADVRVHFFYAQIKSIENNEKPTILYDTDRVFNVGADYYNAHGYYKPMKKVPVHKVVNWKNYSFEDFKNHAIFIYTHKKSLSHDVSFISEHCTEIYSSFPLWISDYINLGFLSKGDRSNVNTCLLYTSPSPRDA